MKRPRRGLWYTAITMFILGLCLMVAQPASASVGSGEFSFSWGQVCVLMAAGVAWGDMRREVHDLRKDVEKMKDRT